MKNIIAVACLLFCGSVFADEPKKPFTVEKVQIKPNPALPVVPSGYSVRPQPGRYYWKHPNFGWGYWYYPAPLQAPAANFYLDEYGRVVPNGFAYDLYGRLVPLQTAQPYYGGYPYGYPYYYGRWGWWRR